MIINDLQKVVTKYAADADSVANAVNNILASAKETYNKDYLEKISTEYNTKREEMLANARAAYLQTAHSIIERARDYIAYTLTDVDTEQFNKIEKMAQCGIDTPLEKETIINQCRGSYWLMKKLFELLHEDSVEFALSGIKRPDTNIYFDILDELENDVVNFINTYEGVSIGNSIVDPKHLLMLQSARYWNNYSERLDYNPAYITQEILDRQFLTPEELTYLNKKLAVDVSTTKSMLESKIIKLVDESEYNTAILMKTEYAAIVRRYLRQKKSEELEDRKYYPIASSIIDSLQHDENAIKLSHWRNIIELATVSDF